MVNNKILDEVMKEIPKGADITDACFEGANIVMYSKDKKFCLESQDIIKKIVDNIKKRVELRPDPKLCMDQEKAETTIKKLIPQEAGEVVLLFDPQRSRVIIEAEKPGIVIGKSGEILKEIKEKTFWVAQVRRVPPIRSPLIENIRRVLYENNDYRRKFLNKIGKKIYDDWDRNKREEWIRLSVLGAGREVGRSCFLLQTPHSKVLLDCGLNVAANTPETMFPIFQAPEFKIEDLDAVIISHAHLDHVGVLPYLYKMGYRGPVYWTSPTRDISALLTLDYIGLSEREGSDSIYGSTDVKEMVKHGICLNYEEVTDITKDIRITFYDAGHGLGSSLVHLHIGNGLHNFLYTGDFNYETSNLLAAAKTRFPRLESVMMESTYGKPTEGGLSRAESEKMLIDVINETAEKQGKILMPVLGVGRSQEIMLIIEKAMREGKIPKMPVYVQGMLWDVTAIHTAYPDFFNARVKKSIFQRDENPFLSDIFKRVVSQKEMGEVIESKGPYIVMATSGMLTGGASLTYFKNFSENPKNALVLTCYQGAGSLGRRLEDGERDFSFIEGGSKRSEVVKCVLKVLSIKGFSGHSNFRQLGSWVQHLEPRPKKIIVIHGEHSTAVSFASNVYQQNRIETNSPKNLEVIRLR